MSGSRRLSYKWLEDEKALMGIIIHVGTSFLLTLFIMRCWHQQQWDGMLHQMDSLIQYLCPRARWCSLQCFVWLQTMMCETPPQETPLLTGVCQSWHHSILTKPVSSLELETPDYLFASPASCKQYIAVLNSVLCKIQKRGLKITQIIHRREKKKCQTKYFRKCSF